MKLNFSEYLEQKELSISSFSSSFQFFLETCYTKYQIGLAPYISSLGDQSESSLRYKLNENIRKRFRIQFHNVGQKEVIKNGKKVIKKATERYYEMDDHYPWLKVEEFLILHFYQIKDSKSVASNKYIAVGLGWLDQFETNQDVIDKALRKVTDSLAILKNDRKSIRVEQKYSYGKKGSHHVIYANWDVIIELYSYYNPKAIGSIRLRKSIRYRIISLIRDNIKAYSERLNELIKAQKNRYLKELIQYDMDDFRDVNLALGYMFDRLKIDIPERYRDTFYYVANYEEPVLSIQVKNPWVREKLHESESILADDLMKKGITLSII